MHFWDEQRLVGRWFARQETPEESDSSIVWDAYFLYAPEALWEAKPQPLKSWGATIRDDFDELEKNLIPLLTAKSEKR